MKHFICYHKIFSFMNMRFGIAYRMCSTKVESATQQNKAEQKRYFKLDLDSSPFQKGKFKDPWPEYPDSTAKRFFTFLYRAISVKERETRRPIIWEYRQILDHGLSAKFFRAQEVVDSKMVFPFFDNKTVCNLMEQKVRLKELFARSSGGISLVIVSQKRESAKNHILSWKKPWKERFPELDCYELILPPLSYRPLNWYLIRTLRKNTPTDEQKNILRVVEVVDVDPDELGIDIENSFVGYPFLVDKFGQVRWKGVGTALPEELDLLFATTEKWRSFLGKGSPPSSKH